eukprot:TRINITY_DN83954_c0_g1_i1.p2 TRINITY_DN83954_c0_g1~~TRINITY_DN83954_c0_g1_i1.p2  ORF type:complete len:325 (-),score=101.74 TRINITY_DN83954_c0_g1_i1:71-1045(-)
MRSWQQLWAVIQCWCSFASRGAAALHAPSHDDFATGPRQHSAFETLNTLAEEASGGLPGGGEDAALDRLAEEAIADELTKAEEEDLFSEAGLATFPMERAKAPSVPKSQPHAAARSHSARRADSAVAAKEGAVAVEEEELGLPTGVATAEARAKAKAAAAAVPKASSLTQASSGADALNTTVAAKLSNATSAKDAAPIRHWLVAAAAEQLKRYRSSSDGPSRKAAGSNASSAAEDATVIADTGDVDDAVALAIWAAIFCGLACGVMCGVLCMCCHCNRSKRQAQAKAVEQLRQLEKEAEQQQKVREAVVRAQLLALSGRPFPEQ